MPEDDKKSAPGIGANSAIIVALFATGAYFYAPQAPLTVLRPPALESRIEEKFQSQDVEARLWQDPFDTVAREINKRDSEEKRACDVAWTKWKKATTENAEKEKERAERKEETSEAPPEKETQTGPPTLPLHCRSPLLDEEGHFRSKLDKVRVIGITAPGAPYFEDAEARRRLRYAVLSGLDLEGYQPQNAQHIGYFRPADHEKKGLPVAVPYEWFTRPGSEPILLLWIDEDLLVDSNKPLKSISLLNKEMCKYINDETINTESCDNKLSIKILGPYTSDLLKRLVVAFSEADNTLNRANGNYPSAVGRAEGNALPERRADQLASEDKTQNTNGIDDIKFYSSGATISEEELGKPLPDGIFRAISSDDVLARLIVKEMGLRGIKPKERGKPAHVVLVSDRDTLYGRSLVKAFWRELQLVECADENDHLKQICAPLPLKEKLGRWERYRKSYLRGIDGMLPSRSSAGDKSSQKDSSDKSQGDASKTLQDTKALERAFGQDQFDYLRRLAASLKEEDDALRSKGEDGIKAIGVLGNDVFDKLLVLRALKPLFPEAIFFTTDYDAALVSREELEWSRNLIVASSYGPTVSKEYQQDVPPFRSSYQTAAFLATRVAVQEWESDGAANLRSKIQKGVASGRLFEINRRGEFLALPSEKVPAAHAPPAGSDEIHPPIPSLYPLLSGWIRVSLIFILSSVTIILLSFYWNGLLFPFLRWTWFGLASVMLASVAIIIGWDFFAGWATENGLGEPIAWAQGISVWPSIALRAIAGVVGACLIVDAWRELHKNFAKIEKRLKLGKGDNSSKSDVSELVQSRETRLSVEFLLKSLSYRLPEKEDDANRVHISSVWKAYRDKESLLPVAIRITFYFITMMVLFASLTFVYGFPNIPWRGSLGIVYHVFTIPVVIFLLVLVFLVFDTTLLCLRFVEVLRHHQTVWPENTSSEFKKNLKIDDKLLDDWIDLYFMAHRTHCISKLIYYPFAIFALMIVSRSTAFAEFAISPPIIITQFVSFLALFGCAMALCFSAEKARKTTRKRLLAGIVAAKAKVENPKALSWATAKKLFSWKVVARSGEPVEELRSGATAEQLETLLKLVNELHEGAFVPLSQQPPIRALLLPLGGLGWTALLDYRLFPGL